MTSACLPALQGHGTAAFVHDHDGRLIGRLIHAIGGRMWAVNRSPAGAEFGFGLRLVQED